MRRYPHTATIEIKKETDGPIPEVITSTFEVKGRYEPAGQNRYLDQSAKFYCPLLDALKADPNALNGQKLIFGGKTIGISQAWNYQIHCELWLD